MFIVQTYPRTSHARETDGQLRQRIPRVNIMR